MEEAIRKLEKMIENPSRADKIVYTRGDIEDAIEWINRLKDRIKELEERIRFLEECLDNKEKVNKSLREDLKIWKLTAKDYAKLCWVDLDDDLNI